MSLLQQFSGSWRALWFRVALVIALLLVVAARLVLSSGARRETLPLGDIRPSVKVRPDRNSAPKTITQGYSHRIERFSAPPASPAAGAPSGPPPLPEDVKKSLVSEPGPISLYPAGSPAHETPAALLPSRYLPSFRLIRCLLINAPQTGDIETPLIGIVLENQYNIDAGGKAWLVIPAGVEVHAMGRPTPVRERIDGDAEWTFVWRTSDEDNATELTVPALALNRDYDAEHRVYGDQEKSPGILGRRFQSFSETVIKEALLDAAAATIRSLKSTQIEINPLTNAVSYQPKPGVRNSAIDGAAAGADRVTKMLDDIRQQIDQKGYYVAVLPGKEFYLYNKAPIDLRLARRPLPLPVKAAAASAQESTAPPRPRS